MPKKRLVNMEMQDTLDELSQLFDEASSHNEFEFVMTLLNYKSIGSMDAQANLHEWFEAIESSLLWNVFR
jgi:hypothetical protein